MQQRIYTTYMCGFVLIALLVPGAAYAQPEYQAISELPNFGVTDTDVGGFLQSIFQLSVIIAALLTVVMIAIGGFTYMTSDAFTDKEDAKKRIQYAVGGLLIILGSYLILNTINPQIFNFDLLRSTDQLESVSENGSENGGGGGTNVSPETQARAQEVAGYRSENCERTVHVDGDDFDCADEWEVTGISQSQLRVLRPHRETDSNEDSASFENVCRNNGWQFKTGSVGGLSYWVCVQGE